MASDIIPSIDSAKEVPCGLYVTTKEIEDKIPEKTLVFYHNHGNPGPGIYPVEKWVNNKAVFSKKGFVIPSGKWAKSLKSLKQEGFYRISKDFHCCEKHCTLFERETLVQLGYNNEGEPIVFIPQWDFDGLLFPKTGVLTTQDKLNNLKPLKVIFKFKSEEENVSIN
jgi:hypothetical protein